jgi:polar amino acid transport system substrate-binding protein
MRRKKRRTQARARRMQRDGRHGPFADPEFSYKQPTNYYLPRALLARRFVLKFPGAPIGALPFFLWMLSIMTLIACRKFAASLFGALALIAAGAAHADRLDDIKHAGVVRIATFDAYPPFGFVDAKSHQTIGLDVDYANAVAQRLGVKLELVSTNPANRIPLMISCKADLVFANFTITDERAKEVDFSIPYFATGTKFIAPKGFLKSPAQINSLRVGADKGTTNEQQIREQFPKATLVLFDDLPAQFAALRAGNVQAIAQDDINLYGLLAKLKTDQSPDYARYEVAPFAISHDYQGAGVPKGEPRLLAAVNKALADMEADGAAQKIYDRWFGPGSDLPFPRTYKIGDPQTK